MSNFMQKIFTARVCCVARREVGRISERKSLFFLTVVLPPLLCLFIAAIYMNRVVTDIPIAVIDQDNSEISRMIIRGAEATRALRIVEYPASVGDIREDFLSGKIQGAIVIPSDLTQNLKTGRRATVVVYNNTTNLLIGNNILKEMTTITRTVSGGVLLKKFRSAGLAPDQALTLANPVAIDTYTLFNPGYNYENYLVPCLLLATLQTIILIGSVLLISTEYHDGTLPELYSAAGNRVFTLIAGKYLPYVLLHTATAVMILGIVFPLFGIPFHGSLVWAFFLIVLFVSATFFVGFFISTLFHNQLMATEAAIFLSTPVVLFSGYIFPLWSMPDVHNVFAHILPFTHFFSGFIKVYQINAPVGSLLPEIGILGIFLCGGAGLSAIALTYRRKHLPAIPPAGGSEAENED